MKSRLMKIHGDPTHFLITYPGITSQPNNMHMFQRPTTFPYRRVIHITHLEIKSIKPNIKVLNKHKKSIADYILNIVSDISNFHEYCMSKF
jgi:hypothetical protein